ALVPPISPASSVARTRCSAPRRSRGPSSSARRLRRLDCELRPATDIRSARPYLPVAPPRRAARRGGSRSDCPRMRVGRSLDHLIRPRQQRRRDRQAERLGGLEVDDQLELGRLLDWEIGRVRTLANPWRIVSPPPFHPPHLL